MKKIPIVLILAACLLFISATDPKKQNVISASEEVMPTINQQIEDILRDEMIKQEIVGIAVGVVKDGTIIYNGARGYSSKERKTLMTTKTPLKWASISKTLTALAAMKLIEEGKLKLTDKVSQYLSETEWPRTANSADKTVNGIVYKKENIHKGDITIAQLLSHRSGINHYGEGIKDSGNTYTNKDYSGNSTSFDAIASVAVFKDADLDFQPGKHYLYSTYGYSLLAAVIEKASPNGYLKYVNDKIKTPLGLTSLAPNYNKFEAYTTNGKGVDLYLQWPSYTRLGGGGWLSTSEDLMKFMRGIMDNKVIKSASLDQMKTNVGNNYGYGMEIRGYCDTFFYGHGGTHDNMLTKMFFTNDQKLGIVIMVNGRIENISRITSRIAKVMGKSCTISDDLVTNSCVRKEGNNNKIAATWRKSTNDVIVRRGYTYNEFVQVSKDLKTIGFHAVDIETYLDGSTRYWDGLFKKEATKSEIVTGLDLNGFNTKWNELSGKGFRLIDLETYKDGSARRWSGIFVNGSGKHALFRNLETTAFGEKRDELTRQGYKLIDVEAFAEGGKLYWSGVWTEGIDGLLNRNMTDSQFHAKHSEWQSKGYKIIDVETYMFNNKRFWAGVWEKSTDSQKINRNLNYCQILEKNELWEKDGYEMQDLEIY